MNKGIIYKVSIEHNGGNKFYSRFTANYWKIRYYHHKMILSNKKKYSNATEPSKFFQQFKRDYEPVVNWNFITKPTPFTGPGEKCIIYVLEKLTTPNSLLNKRNENMTLIRKTLS